MVSVSLVLLFVLFVVLRKVFKTNKVEGIVSISASNLNAQKIVHEDDIGGWDKSGLEINPCTLNFVAFDYSFAPFLSFIATESQFRTFHKLKHGTQSAFSSMFYWWSKNVVCRFPLISIFLSLCWSVPLIVGMLYVEFTTDPIRLWASPDSRSFKEYEKFNQKFVPFYRASQIIAVLRDDVPKRNEPIIFTGRLKM